MSVAQKKAKVFGNIAAAQTLVNNLPRLKKKNSFSSVNNKGDVIGFLTDIIISLLGTVALINAVIDILTKSLGKIEKDIKNALKLELKSIVSCGINPSLPDFLKSTGSGIVIEVKKIDFINLFKVDPNTNVGKLLYDDVTPQLVDSTEFNTFLSGVIKNDGQTFSWNNIFDITFNSVGTATRPNNTFTIKANSSYNTKSINDLNNDFINSLTLFNTRNLVVRIIEIIFGSISFSISKSRKQLEEEEMVNRIIDKMIDEDINQDKVIDDETFFTFNNEEMVVIENRSSERQRGIIKIKTTETISSSVPVSSLESFSNTIEASQTEKEKKEALANSLNQMADESSKNSKNRGDKYNIKLNFFISIIRNLIKVIVGIVLSPKIVMIFLINYKIVYGPSASYKNAVDFIKKNKKLFRLIIKRIAGMIIKILLAIAMKRITKLISDAVKEKAKEKIANKKTQMLSLVGVPQEVLRRIKGLM
jgi:hypothetical protein